VSTVFPSRGRRYPALLALVALLIAGAALLTLRGSAHAQAPAGPKPSIVLVHGAWADASSWDGEIGRLQADGFTVDAPADPLRSLSGDATYIASYLKTINGPIVLVGHSYGGAVITNAASGNRNVKALVYIDGFAPDQGETVLSLAAKNPGSELPTSIATVPYTDGTTSGMDVYIKPADFRAAFAADVPARKAALMAATQRPVTYAALSEPSGVPAWRTIPSWYLVGLRDQAIPPPPRNSWRPACMPAR
jgi:pimeloyl-ACP methyl ester carboxylesterase